MGDRIRLPVKQASSLNRCRQTPGRGSVPEPNGAEPNPCAWRRPVRPTLQVKPFQVVGWNPAGRLELERPVGEQERRLYRPGRQDRLLYGIENNGQRWPKQHRPEHRCRSLLQFLHPAGIATDADLREYHAESVQLTYGAAPLFDYSPASEFLVHPSRDDVLPARTSCVTTEHARLSCFPPPGHTAV